MAYLDLRSRNEEQMIPNEALEVLHDYATSFVDRLTFEARGVRAEIEEAKEVLIKSIASQE